MRLYDPPKRRRWFFRWLGIGVLGLLVGLSTWRNLNPPAGNGDKLKAIRGKAEEIVSSSPPQTVYEDVFFLELQHWNRLERKMYTVQSGDSLSKILHDLGVSAQNLGAWHKESLALCRPEDLKVGDLLEIDLVRGTQDPVRLEIQGEGGERRLFLKQGDAWVCRIETPPAFTLTETALGTIQDNLYSSCVDQGMPAKLIMDLADLFAYDIDFTSDLRPGDRFAVLYEITVGNGRLIKAGPIQAARMNVSGQTYEAYLYEFPDGFRDYFDARGRSLRKMFLKAPLSYRRISSTFTYRRLHPVLKIFRPHLGIDYAAPAGTPVSAIGDGKVIKMGWNGGFGRYVEIQHNGVYRTSYGHLSAFAKGLKKGARVKQGDVIGYVGSSGLATGPHLDFRFYKNGKPVNFLKTAFPHARSIPANLMADFGKKRRELESQLRLTAVAFHGTGESRHP
ncbi:M23 family metallopeptidase [Desulfosoma caldarium]|uniref:Murein DD-endopeptidase MepM/ murein hydrolase activator NlpD n=1 Tax=Desulfosoma caldarium TaxID=610254 RepID=A0A3N1UUD6_9BACT|nr:peptidoglycan DD-metalloendopeptidase family protein [Desulfosoma caldarium]ROQ90726.1 murein DD-endopeptidase MepM/ murein hydrolase activator NlpD [Desulfosoma caldarium]